MTQGKQNLNDCAGSFQTSDQQKAMSKAVEGRHGSFAEVVAEKNRNQSVDQGQSTSSENMYADPPGEGVSLTQADIAGEGSSELAPPQQFTPQAASTEEDTHEEKNEYGDTICRYCKSVLKTDKPDSLLDIKDDELTTYMFGGRISRVFKVGSVEFSIQSLLQNEVDDVAYRAGQDMENGSISLESDYRTRHSTNRLVYSLQSVQGQKLIPDPPKSVTIKDVEEWFNNKNKIILAYAHQFVVLLSEKQSILENSINYAINNQVRLKN